MGTPVSSTGKPRVTPLKNVSLEESWEMYESQRISLLKNFMVIVDFLFTPVNSTRKTKSYLNTKNFTMAENTLKESRMILNNDKNREKCKISNKNNRQEISTVQLNLHEELGSLNATNSTRISLQRNNTTKDRRTNMTECCKLPKNNDERIKEVDKDLTGINKPNEKVDNEKTKRIEDVNKNEYASFPGIWETKVMKRLS